jgi:hypothetical protein
LRNTGFYGDGKSAQISEEQWINVDEEMMSPSLLYWTIDIPTKDENGNILTPKAVSDTDSASGYSIFVGEYNAISQVVENCIAGENYILSLKLKGICQFEFGGVEINLANNEDQYVRITHSFKAINESNTFTIRTANNVCQICELMLERGTIPSNNWQRSIKDVNPEIVRVQNLQYLADAMQKGQTDILGGLILTNMIELGKPKYTGEALKTDEVTCGINGNSIQDDNDVAIWGGGTWQQAKKTVEEFAKNPQFQPTQEELAQMAKFVITHGGTAILNEAIVRGTVFATNGRFSGEVNATSGTFKDVVINGTYNRLVQTINSNNYSNYLYLPDIYSDYYALMLQWGDIIHLDVSVFNSGKAIVMPSYIPYRDGTEIKYNELIGYKHGNTDIEVMNVDDIRSLIGRKIIIHCKKSGTSDIKLHLGMVALNCEKMIGNVDDGAVIYMSTENGEFEASVTSVEVPLPTEGAVVLECLLGRRVFKMDGGDNTKGQTVKEMIYWSYDRIVTT